MTAPVDLKTLIMVGARDRAVVVRKAAAQGLVRHYRTIPDLPLILSAFDKEKNAAIRERLDFIRRRIAAG